MLRKSLPSILFLALSVPPLSALDESLVGTWEASGEGDEGSFTARVVFHDDGTFEFSSVSRTEDGYWRPPQFQEDDDLSADEADALTLLFDAVWPETPLETSSFLGSGTYAASGDSLRMEWIDVDLTYDGRGFTDFMVPFYIRFSLNQMALHSEGGELSEEARLALEEEAETQAREIMTLEVLLRILNEPWASPRSYGIRNDGEGPVLQGPGFFADALLFQEADARGKPLAKPLAYRRVDVASAVAPAAWGRVKSTLAR
ncbi:MAG: hypothetical protein OXG13_06135 [Gemmatimonadaceae bacterium]|nr:hypothetical protein [Gemmatimonadaceae bacterium]